jgi:hypothetical protein
MTSISEWEDDWTFTTRDEAEAALQAANAKWPPDEEYKPEGRVVSVYMEEGMIVEINTPNATHGFAVMNENCEYMVTREDPEWVCVA